MSIQQSVAIEQCRMPTTDQIVAKAAEWGFEIGLESADLRTHSGYLPGSLNGTQGGFEWLVEPSEGYADWPVPIEFGSRDVVVTLTTHSDETECQLAMICAGAVLELADGVLFDDFDNVDTSPDRILEEVRQWIEDS
jgi:hypothetical protein